MGDTSEERRAYVIIKKLKMSTELEKGRESVSYSK